MACGSVQGGLKHPDVKVVHKNKKYILTKGKLSWFGISEV